MFKAAVTGLLARHYYEKLSIGLFPGFVNKRVAKIELVQEAVQLETLDKAFTLLKFLDNPVQSFDAMQKLCRVDWYRFLRSDDLFYQHMRQEVHVKASVDMVCTILVS